MALYSTNQLEDDYVMLHEDKELKASSMDVNTREKRDVDGLLCFKKGITSDPRGYLSNWIVENKENVCSWEGIWCRKHTRRVVVIYLPSLHLEGTLSPYLGNLSLLKYLDLSHNSFTGTIPPDFAQLKALRYLFLGFNNLSGSIPVEVVSNLNKLKYLYLSGNMLTSSIPEAFANMSNLRMLSLFDNHLIGTIQKSIGKLKSLKFFLLESK